jgi:hypothetical protein
VIRGVASGSGSVDEKALNGFWIAAMNGLIVFCDGSSEDEEAVAAEAATACWDGIAFWDGID